MSDRRFSAAFTSFVAAASLFVLASAAGAQDKPAAPAKPVRHLDLEVGAGVHWGTAKNTPLEDDFYANVGLALPVMDKLDGEFQIGYYTGNDNNRHDDPGEPKSDARSGAYLNLGLRYYVVGAADAPTRFFFSTGPSMLTEYRRGDTVTPAWSLGPGFRILIGQHSGFVARVPVAIMLDGDPEPLLLPTLNYFYQF